MEPQEFIPHTHNAGHGIFLIRDFTLSTPEEFVHTYPDHILAMAEHAALHCDACKVYRVMNVSISSEGGVAFAYAVSHRGMITPPGHFWIAEVEYIAQN